jgi:hypothetical protein
MKAKRRNAAMPRRRGAARSRRRNVMWTGRIGEKPPKPSKHPEEPAPVTDRLVHLAHSSGAAVASSIAAVKLAQWGVLDPSALAWLMGITGSVVSLVNGKRRWVRSIANGVASAGGSQVVLQWLTPPHPRPATPCPATPAAPKPPANPPPPPKPRGVDMGQLPPHALEDAFGRAQAALALGADPYVSGTGG